MGAMEFLQKGELAKIDAATHVGIRVHKGNVWLTQRDDPNDYVLGSGAEMRFIGKEGPVLMTAVKPSLLELYHADPIGLRQVIERHARTARSAGIHAACATLLRAAARLLRRTVPYY